MNKPTRTAIRPLEHGSLSARTYASLRNALISGHMKPGDRLLMQDLAERLGTSVTPVREACFRLVSEQALELRSGRFIVVPELTRSRYMQIRIIRLALEGLAAELAASNATAKDVARLTKIHTDFVAAEAAGASDKARQANQKFHFGVYTLCGMDMLVNQIENLWVSMGPILNIYHARGPGEYVGAEEHEHLLKALVANDGTASRTAIVADIERGGENLLRYFDEIDRTRTDATE